MIVYTVHEQPHPPADRIERAAALEFNRDGFSLIAAITGPLWLLAERLWLPLLGYIGAMIVLGLLGAVIGPGVGWAILALHLAIGFEASSLRRWGLESRGWSYLGAVTGRDRDECERRFYSDWLPTMPAVAATQNNSGDGGKPASGGRLESMLAFAGAARKT